ncbi:MAG: ABC transporter substrate-binding protein [Dehalococcoidia bacterium]|nr:ABC transporter substrate-binding protein [Dehalococcoidia bacterium]
MHRRVLILLTAFALGAALLAACGGDDDNGGANATATAGIGSASSPTATAAAVYPMTVKDMLGKDVTIKAQPQRIVAASPSAIELLYAAGGKAVARTTTAKIPAEVTSLPDIGTAEKPAYERIVQQNPDLVLADASLQAQFAPNFASSLAGVPVLFVGAQKYDDIATSLQLIGKVINNPEKAASAVKAMEDAKTQVKNLVSGKTAPRTLILIGAPNDPFVALTDSFIGNLAGLAGAKNVAAGEPQSGPLPGYTKLSLEKIVAADPEVILTITAGPPGGPSLADGIKSNAAYATLSAVKNGRVRDLDVEVYLQSPSPRAAQGLKDLAALLFPGAGASATAAATPTATPR